MGAYPVPTMSTSVVGRQAELQSIGSFLESITAGPGALILYGEAGIGKTTLWREGLAEASGHGYAVLVCRPAQSEVQLSYSSIADLLADLDEAMLSRLPVPQREALEVVRLRSHKPHATADRRVVATAFLAILHLLSDRAPVLVAVDDFQWLDRNSAQALEFAGRRVTGKIGFLFSFRTNASNLEEPTFRLASPDGIGRLDVGPLSLAAIHHVLRERFGRTYPHPALVRIHEASAGNPFLALELVRVYGGDIGLRPHTRLSTNLSELTGARLRGLDRSVREVLLATAALAAPTVDVLRQVAGADAAASLESAEDLGIVEVDGPVVRFTHPILASAVYSMASPKQRRAMHRQIAGTQLHIEERARHLALAATSHDEETIRTLDEAAENASTRGAASAAADLLELALQLGADDAGRKIRAAAHHYDAGDPLRARDLLEGTIDKLAPGKLRAEALRLLARVRIYDDSYQAAAPVLERALADAADDDSLRVQIEIDLSFVLFNLGRLEDALSCSERMVSAAERLTDTALIAQALALATSIRFMAGMGLDEPTLERALALESRVHSGPIALTPSLQASLIWMWSGRLDQGHTVLEKLYRECLEKGAENDLVFLGFQIETLACWRGDLASATRLANDCYERALQLGTELPLALALSAQAHVAAFRGDVSEARKAAEASYEILQRGTLATVALAPLGTLGFIELSLDNYGAAAMRLGPMAAGAIAVGLREPSIVPFAPNAAEALVAVGNLDDAKVLIEWLEDHGRRLDRPWALAVGGRCRSLLLAAMGELEAAIRSCEQALVEHGRIDMPFELARTMLVLGRLQRRRGRRRDAKASLEVALEIFTNLGTRLWTGKAQHELARLGIRRGAGLELTPSEERIAQLAASGQTNRQVAAAMLISPKTVEANLVRVYQKLDIRSRAELGRRMAEAQIRIPTP